MSDVTIREILEANPYGITRPGLLAWARLRIDPAFDDARLAAELTALGDAIVEEGGFVTLAAPGTSVPGSAAPASQPWASQPWASQPTTPSPAEDRSAAPLAPHPPAPAPDTSDAWTADLPDAPYPWTPPAAGPATVDGRQAPDAGSAAIDGWQAPARAAPRRRLWGIAGFAVIAVIVLQLVGASFGSSGSVPAPTGHPDSRRIDASALAPGICHQVPGVGTFYDVEVRDCPTPHDAEVYAVVEHPAPSGEPYPGDDVIERYVQTVCDPAFIRYTGLDPHAQTELAQAWYGPTEEGWSGGDRQVICYFTSASGDPLTHSYRVGS